MIKDQMTQIGDHSCVYYYDGVFEGYTYIIVAGEENKGDYEEKWLTPAEALALLSWLQDQRGHIEELQKVMEAIKEHAK